MGIDANLHRITGVNFYLNNDFYQDKCKLAFQLRIVSINKWII